MRGLVAIVMAAGLVLGLSLVPSSGADTGARARALALVAGGSVGPHGDVSARGNGEQRASTAVHVAGLDVSSGDAVARASVDGETPTARASAAARSVDVLDGLVTAYGVRRTVEAQGASQTASGLVNGLKIDGRMVGDVSDARTMPLPNGAGRVVVNTGEVGLLVVLDRPTRGMPAGTEIRVAIAQARARVARQRPQPTPEATPEPTPQATPEADRPSKRRKSKREEPLDRRPAPEVRSRLTAGGFAFPVYGEATVADDFGGPRQIGPHQGNDIFADFGAPVVAVADGVLSKVGTLPISGNRLWLTTDGGDAFFYAHMSAFAPAARNGARVKAGTVIGFVGNTGDAEPTPPHVHFEIHPGGEAEDAIDPHEILLAWQGRRDVPPGAWLQRYGPDTAERPGALVAVRDFIAE